MSESVYSKALQRAAAILGGTEKLREFLHVPKRALDKWIAGIEQPPVDIFLKAVDVVCAPVGPAPAVVQRSRELQREASALRVNARRTLKRSQRILAAVLGDRADPAVPDRSAMVDAFLAASYEPGEGRAMVEAALDAAMDACRASMGDVQLSDAGGLRIVAQRGFEQPFLDFFAWVKDESSACGLAFKQGVRVVVADVASHPVFAGKPAAAVMEEAHSRALQSTPLIAATGEVLGILSTHFDHPHVPSDAEFEALDQIARRAAFWLDGATVLSARDSRSIKTAG